MNTDSFGRMVVFSSSLLICLVGPLSGASVVAVEERDGDIYVRDDRSITPRRVTDSGKDHSPALSPDGKQIVFVRDLLGDRDYSDFSSIGAATRSMQLWIADVNGRQPPKLVLDSPVEVKNRQFSGFYTPQFSGDQDYVYFLIQFGASSGAIVRSKLGTKDVLYVTDALAFFSVIPSGKYKGDLIAKQHRPKLALGYYDWFYLLKPTAEQIGVIGEGKDDVEYFLSTYVDDYGSCPSWNTPAWMTCINQVRRVP